MGYAMTEKSKTEKSVATRNLRKEKPKIPWKYRVLIVIAVVIISLDQWTKHLILMDFNLGETLPIVNHFFNLTYVQNKGAAFGLLAQANPAIRVPFFMIVPFIALTSIGYVFSKLADHDLKASIAFSLVISGALGNLADRLSLGYVVDFLDFHWNNDYHFPAFNVADSAICIGVSLLILDMLMANSDALKKRGT
jgi:signal peptidase II